MLRSITFILFLAVFTNIHAQNEILDRVVAQVGGEYILESEIDEFYRMEQNQRKNVDPSFKCAILENLLLQKLLTNQAKIDSVEVSNDQVENQLNARIDRVLAYLNNDVAQFESYYGKSVSEMKDDLREDLKNQLMSEEIRNKIVASITVTPEEVKEYFRNIPTDSIPYYNAEVEYSELIFYPKINKIERQKVLDKLGSLRNRIVEQGESFEELAKKFSEDGSAANGGDLGWSKRGNFVPEFEAAVFNLEEGQVSQIIESEFGFHLIRLDQRRGNTFKARHILIKPQITNADKENALRSLDSITNLINTDVYSFTEAVRKFGNKNFPSYSNGGRAINQNTGTNYFEISDLEPDVYFTLDTMKIGQISQPIEFTDPYGEKAYKIVYLTARSEPHRASLKTDFSRLKDDAIAIKRNETLLNWVEEKQHNTFITIQPEFISLCPNIGSWRLSN